MNKKIKTADLFDCKTSYLIPLFENSIYPWEIVSKIKEHIYLIIKNGLEGFFEIEKDIFIGKNVEISKNATLIAPAIIGKNTIIRPGAYIRGSVITGENCVIGNSSELKNCVFLNNVQVPHYNYVGDSVLGNFSHLGAGVILSNLKADKKPVVIHGEREFLSNLKKLGGILADYVDIGCGCVVNPGTIIGKNTSSYPLTSLRGVYPENSIIKNQNTIVERL